MTEFEWVNVILTVVGMILLPFLALTFRGMIKWTRVEIKLDHAVGSLEAIAAEMRADRKATNERLTWLERNVWKGST